MSTPFERARERGVDPKTQLRLEQFEEQTARNARDADAYASMGAWWINKNEFPKAVEHLNLALEFDPDNVGALRLRAKLRATCPDDQFRDGKAALNDVTRAIDIEAATGRLNGDWLHRLYLRILAAAYAELSEFDAAVETATEALELAITKATTGTITRELKAYKTGRAWRGVIR